jgi:hypothetical protein
VNQLVAIGSPSLPALVSAAGERASMRFLEFLGSLHDLFKTAR